MGRLLLSDHECRVAPESATPPVRPVADFVKLCILQQLFLFLFFLVHFNPFRNC